MRTPSEWRQNVAATVTSLSFHTVLLGLFGAVHWGVSRPAPVTTLAAGFAPIETEETVVSLPKVQPESTTDTGGQSAAPTISAVDSTPLPVATLSDTPAPATSEPTTSIRQAAAVSVGQGNGENNGDGAGQGGAFFDVSAAGTRVVYVVDSSKSMNRPYPSPEKTRFGRVKRELIQSIQSLAPEQEWFVIFFNTEAHPMPATRMLKASSNRTPQYLNWLATFRGGGRTDPEPALQMALRLRPDAIFFLTDGDFKPQVVDRVVAANARQTPVHTIGFGDDVQQQTSRAVDTLSRLADETGGRASFISDDGRIVRR